MLRASLSLLLPCLLGPAVAAQAVDPPVAERPVDFSWVVGSYAIRSAINRTEVEVEEPILLTVTIIETDPGKNPAAYHPVQDKLQLFGMEGWQRFFYEPLPERTRALPEKGAWEFVYRIRPRSTEVTEVPSLRLCIYDPRRGKYPPKYADAIPIKVTPTRPAEAVQALRVVEAPDAFFELQTGSRFWSPAVERTLMALLLLGAPAVSAVLFLIWRRGHPDVGAVRARRRSRAAQQALRALEETGEQPERLVATLVRYLEDRFDFPTVEATASEVGDFLARRGTAKAVHRRWRRFFEACAEARFAANGTAQRGLEAEASDLVRGLEDQPCLSA